MVTIWRMLAVPLLTFTTVAHAGEPATPLAGPAIPVPEAGGKVESDLRPYAEYLAALNEVEAFHALAPSAILKFWAVSPADGPGRKNVKVHIDAGDYIVPLPVADDGAFVVPIDKKLLDLKAAVVINRYRTDRFLWGMVVRTPGLPKDAFRLGDLRLECHAYQAILPRRDAQAQGAIGKLCDSPDRLWINEPLLAPSRGFTLTYKNASTFFAISPPAPDAGNVVLSFGQRKGAGQRWPDDTLLRFIAVDAKAPVTPPQTR